MCFIHVRMTFSHAIFIFGLFIYSGLFVVLFHLLIDYVCIYLFNTPNWKVLYLFNAHIFKYACLLTHLFI